jgi:tetratricopeptide (TPR) repeat protein
MSASSRPYLRRILVGVAVLFVVGQVGLFAFRRYYLLTPEEHYARGLAALENGDSETVERAIAALEWEQSYGPQRAYLLGAWLIQKGDMAAGLESLKLAAESPRFRTKAMVLAGQKLYEAGHAGDAQRMWATVLEHEPNAVDAHRWLGAMYYDVGAMQDALRHLDRAGQLAPRDPRPLRLMGLINKDYERYEAAVKCYRESLRRDPQQPGADGIRLELAETQVKLHEHKEALETLATCLEGPQKSVLEAECSYNLGKPEEALAAVARALTLADAYVPALLLQADMLLDRGDATRAVEALRQAVTAQPKNYQARFKFAQSLRRAGRTAEADEQTAKAEELRNTWQRFSELHNVAISQPDNIELRCELGTLAEHLDRPDLAKNWYRAALLIDPAHPQANRKYEALRARSNADPGGINNSPPKLAPGNGRPIPPASKA